MKKKELKAEIDNLQSQISLLSTELEFLQAFCRHMGEENYVQFLYEYRDNPAPHLNPGERYA